MDEMIRAADEMLDRLGIQEPVDVVGHSMGGLDAVRAPTLILAGQHDPEASVACSEELLQGIADGSLVIFEESGHAPFIEEALACAWRVPRKGEEGYVDFAAELRNVGLSD